MNSKIKDLRDFFQTGNTLSYEFRIKQLNNLKEALEKYEEDIITALRLDMKKPKYEAYTSEIALIHQELSTAMDNLKHWMEREKVSTPLYLKPASSYIYPRPKGLVFIISPWNYPFLLTFCPLIAAIAAGNTVLIKASIKANYSQKLIYKILEESFESYYISYLEGDGSLVMPLIAENDFDHIFFTGSKNVGRKLASLAASKLIPFTLELGGKSPAIVDETTDIHLAAKKITWAKFLNLGQTCIAPDYILVKETVREEFIERVKANILSFYGEDIIENEDYGRIINLDRFKRLLSFLDEDKILFGGSYREEDLFIAPTIMEASLEDELMKEEIFGPIMPIIPYLENIDIVDIISLNPNPLALYLFTDNDSLVEYVLNGVSFGGGCINDTISHMVNTNMPFGGVRQSGIGKYHSKYGFDEFSHLQPILHSTKNIDIDVKYPPYTKTKTHLSKFFLK